MRPFSIDIDQAQLDDLASRLANTRWPEAEAVDDWSQGLPLSYAQEIAAYWADGYDWRAREARINRFDQFVTEVDGLDIHFIHQRSSNPDAFPLVITHGWPGSIVEFDKVIEPLTEDFHVVCPSLPGFGFSGKPDKHGWTTDRIAVAWDTLMGQLGYERYGAQGGDWGSMVTHLIGANGGRCAGVHLNMPLGAPTEEAMANPSEADAAAFAAITHYQEWDSGYSKQQSTRPQTLGYGLVDSPTGQMAWILEKMWAWTDCDGHPENALTRDEMLDNIMIYWLNAAAASSGRLYWESFGKGNRPQVEVPVGVAAFPEEIIKSPRSWCESTYNITHWTDMPKGGHFAAWEQPELFVDDVRAFFNTIR